MHRRQALSLGLVLPGLWPAAALRAQPSTPGRAAVVIGVDQAGDLPALRGARSGALQVASWLQREGFEVRTFVDGDRPVVASELFDAVSGFVGRGTTTQLVIYFAGHGFINGYSEHWMLSKAPDNPNEAISLIESVTLARQSAVPNVVFISDACRSRSDSLRTERVRGSLIFPTSRSAPATPTDVDLFLAPLVGDPSWEVPVGQSVGSYQGIYTAAFLDAYKNPARDMVKLVGGQMVVPNAQLKGYLAREVPARAQRVSLRLRQLPDTQVMSGDATFIGRAMEETAVSVPLATPMPVASAPSSSPAPSPPPTSSIPEMAAARIAAASPRGWATQQLGSSPAAIALAARDSGFDRARATISAARELPVQVASRTGFAITGASLKRVVASRGIGASVVDGSDNTALVKVDLGHARAASVALYFDNGTGTVLAALDGFIGNVVVDKGGAQEYAQGVSNVSYVPSRSNPLYEVYRSEQAHLADLHATVATAARFGVFRIEGQRETRNRAAGQIADRIRMLKGIDPTLGIYAAYAYADAGLKNQVQSVMSIMRGDLGVELFDVSLLDGALVARTIDRQTRVVPFVPMLAQGWSLLRVLGARVPERALAARDDLRPSLWTTLGPQGMLAVERVLREEEVL